MSRITLMAWTYAAVGWLGAACIMVITILALGRTPPHQLPSLLRIVVATGVCTVAMVWTVFFAMRAYGQLDEFQWEKAKATWHLGSILGLSASLPLFVFIGMGGLHWLDPAIPAGIHLFRAFAIGYTLPILCLGAGSVVARYWLFGSTRR